MESKSIYDIDIKSSSVLFFDMDGTLIDTDLANFLSYKKAIQLVTEKDIYLTYNQEDRFNRSKLKITVPNLSDTEYDTIIEVKEKCYQDFLPETKLNNPIVHILYKYSKTNRIVLVTNCRKERAVNTLNYHRLTDKFNNFFFRQLGDNNQRINKFQNAIESLDISPQNIIVFENEMNEIEDAVRAGIIRSNIIKF